MYETTIPGGITEQSFRSQLFIDISEYMDTKNIGFTLFSISTNKMRSIWFDAITGRAAYRGYQMNCKYAECFEVIRTSKW